MNNQKLLASLFETVKCFVLSDGSDGDAVIVCPKYKELAAIFEEYEKAHGNWFNERTESPNSVTFANDQEFICFTFTQPVRTVGQPGIIAEIPPWYVDSLQVGC